MRKPHYAVDDSENQLKAHKLLKEYPPNFLLQNTKHYHLVKICLALGMREF